MSQVADYVLQRLTGWGVHRIFGYPGDGINGFLGAFDRAGGDPGFLQTRHEEMAAFMACAHAKFTGEVGACVATSGPGAIHLLNGLYDARLDHQPVLAIVGQQRRTSLGAHYQQEIDLISLFKDVTEYVQYCMAPPSARHLVDRAMKTALSSRAPVCLIFPEDVQEEKYTEPPHEHGAVRTSIGWTKPRILPDPDEVRRAAAVLNRGRRVAMLIGQGAAGAREEVTEAADLLGAGVAKALLGKDALPDTLPFVTGPIGLLGSEASHKMVMGADTLLLVGTSFPYSEWLPREGQAAGVQIDIDGRMIGIRYPMDVHLVGDAAETLRQLIPLLIRKEDRSWRRFIEREVATWQRVLADRARLRADPMNPQIVAYELDKRLPDNAILTADSGSATTWWARYLRIRGDMKASLSGTLATMLPGVPYAVAAKLAYPERPVIAFVGDGAFSMLGMNELFTVKRYWERMNTDPRLVFTVFVNEDLNQVSYEQRVMAGDRINVETQKIPYVPAADFARLLGFTGIRCDSPDKIGAAWEQALAADRPVVLEVVVDAKVPPLPPHVRPEQMRKTARAFLQGDPEAVGIAVQGFKGKWQEAREHLPHAARR
ncbi:thiamine pyrophosphate-dependent enzyme, possible carboligase or decarboxylase [Frankia casuarinae]|uniref:Thiamine pyrophosphate enzyme-like TPP binding region n=1 Tax=Frankia casuarinae (strain DSM 45818 / CECT 9043 / HFP020203 / CcI3) TaxID=106370 RepID=Q2JA30_FRACC|nr:MULTISPECIES: thiamine pyrophosphate-requiring protein [Frankia]ABD11862.1 thiamine pyrophosphate enzyme-like TPP binding region [Frankia casuarinae]ETA00743.1 thiamine pyrophosphate-dependent enzyme, possible carboligase or decarboxylase [Frankia sp. CcI6]EYT90657.1 thiamine pyrophosphate-dependent enzyme, possible carboligase or decarboxylase [Frankia casuarinae]KDA41753.1 thiamine pyrophosphate-dependent enzyme, possible carboligase or decarboxylase [Frankia sp. BMG5.23]KFB03214.1 thiami